MLWNAKNGRVAIGPSDMDYVSFGSGPKNLIILPGRSDGLATVKGKALMLAGPYRRYCKNYTIYMFSRRSDLPEGISIREMAADQAQALQKLGIEKTSVLGVSQGGMIAQFLAADYPERVEKLVLAVTAPSANPLIRDNILTWIELAGRREHRKLMIDTAEKSYSERFLRQFRMSYPVIGFVGKPKSYDRFLANARAILDFDAGEAIGKIGCPTLIIGGEEDKIVGAQASRELQEGIPGSRLYLYPGLGHGAYEEAKDFNKRVFAFLEEP